MAAMIDFQERIASLRDMEFHVYTQRRKQPVHTPILRATEKPAVELETADCKYDGRPFRRAIGRGDEEYCRPACAQAAARKGTR